MEIAVYIRDKVFLLWFPTDMSTMTKDSPRLAQVKAGNQESQPRFPMWVCGWQGANLLKCALGGNQN